MNQAEVKGIPAWDLVGHMVAQTHQLHQSGAMHLDMDTSSLKCDR